MLECLIALFIVTLMLKGALAYQHQLLQIQQQLQAHAGE